MSYENIHILIFLHYKFTKNKSKIQKTLKKIKIVVLLFNFTTLFLLNKKYSKENILLKGRHYLNRCLNGELLNNKNKKYFKNPKISIVIPIYNCQNSIKRVIRSIQNQKMFKIEILLVNDNSKDDSLKIIQIIQKEDKRIKIINNKKNMGTLFSRCIGVLKSMGEYIFPLDNDDMLFNNNILTLVYKEAKNYNYDIIGFQAVQSNNYYANITEIKNGCHMHYHNFVVTQPELSLFGISKKNKEVHIWSKSIKTSIYKKAINALGKERYSYFISWAEDISMLFILFSFAESYKYITIYGIFRYNRKNSASSSMPNSHKLFGEIFFLDIIFDFTKNNFMHKKFVVYKAIQIRKSRFFKSLNKITKKYLIIVLKKILSCKYIINKDKNTLKKFYEDFV